MFRTGKRVKNKEFGGPLSLEARGPLSPHLDPGLFTNILVTRAVRTSLCQELSVMQVYIVVKVSQYIPQDGFLNSAAVFVDHNSALLSILQ